MSLIPVFIQTDRLGRRDVRPSSHRLVVGLSPNGALTLVSPSNHTWSQPSVRNINISSRENFEINLDVHHFAPEDISVKIIDGYLVIQAAHEEKRDEYGWVKRQFTRRYALPEGCDLDAIEPRLSSDGVLTVIAPHTAPRNERSVPILQTGPVRNVREVAAEMGDGEARDSLAATLQ